MVQVHSCVGGSIAQLVERPTVNRKVDGSIPSGTEV